MAEHRRSWWGWGWQDQALTAEQAANLGAAVAARLGRDEMDVRPPPRLEDLTLPATRLTPPDSLARICSSLVEDRAGH
ncbi:MAG: FAD-binding oxidoreductase, partial [Actinobacteria bacterium]|nr:FAD-binding oxidoreductase [Actinomycetota bacterium]